MPHILLLEPYYGGSHKSFLTGLQRHVPCLFSLLTLPARKWKMRMQLSAPWFAEQIIEQIAGGTHYDAVLCSTFLDVAVLRSLLANAGIMLPLGIYFHENQFCYPGQVVDPGVFQFSAINFTSALCADQLAFNSCYNLNSFLAGVKKYLKKAADVHLGHCLETLRNKSTVLYPGMDYSHIDDAKACLQEDVPVIVWNHRWEHDKDPDTFFKALISLSDNIDFKLILAGEHFHHQPPVFARAKEILKDRILHVGFVEKKEEYACLLQGADIIASTAVHEFFGISVLEGVRAGCWPLVPDRLSYRELFPEQYRYPENGFKKALVSLLEQWEPLVPSKSLFLTEPYSWSNLAGDYTRWLEQLCAVRPGLANKLP